MISDNSVIILTVVIFRLKAPFYDVFCYKNEVHYSSLAYVRMDHS